jgi:tRNA1(Val) A37 N6-methylase TrmN6
MTIAATSFDVTKDAFLGGRVEAFQPATGHHRSGLEAVLLGASLPADFAGGVIDLGAGAGVAGFCAAARCPGTEVTLVEREAAMIACARRSLDLAANRDVAGRVRIAAVDIRSNEASRMAAGIAREAADAVLTNPPFHAAADVRPSSAPARVAAHILETNLDDWFRAASWSLRPGGTLIAITAAASITELLDALTGRFGAAALLPLHPRPGLPAERLLVRATRGGRAGPQILPGLVLHGSSGNGFTPPLEAILRDGAGLGDVHQSWQAGSRSPS